MNAKLSKVNQSIEKTIQIVEVMARGKGPMRLQDVAKKCGMPASTVMRMLNTLQVYGYVNQDPCTQHYSLSLRFARLGCLVSEQTNMRDVARPFLAELAQRCQETVCLGCEAEMEVECTDVVDGPDGILMVSQRVGARAPLHATGAGKLLLLNYSNQKLNEYIAVKGLRAPDAPYTGHAGGAGEQLGDDTQPGLCPGGRGAGAGCPLCGGTGA